MVSIVWQQHNCMQVQITVIYLTMSEKNQPSASTTVVQIQLMWRKKLINNPSVHNQFNFQLNHFPCTSFHTYRRRESRSLPLMSVAQSFELTRFCASQCKSLYFHWTTDMYLCSTLCNCKKGLQPLPLSHYRRHLPHDSQGHPTSAKYWFRNRISWMRLFFLFK